MTNQIADNTHCFQDLINIQCPQYYRLSPPPPQYHQIGPPPPYFIARVGSNPIWNFPTPPHNMGNSYGILIPPWLQEATCQQENEGNSTQSHLVDVGNSNNWDRESVRGPTCLVNKET